MLLAAISACTISDDEEIALGDKNAIYVNAHLPIVDDPQIVVYLNQLGNQIASRTARANLRWHFYLVNSSEINAFALPGGHVYVNRGLIEQTDRLDELAGTLGHEIGHVVERHSVKQMQHSRYTNIWVAIFCSVTNACDNGLTQIVINVGSSAYMARYSRIDEAEADSEAVENVLHAGIDPRGIPSLFEKLLRERENQPVRVEQWFSDHPLEETRIAATRRAISRLLPVQPKSLIQDSKDFQLFRARVANLPRLPTPTRPPRSRPQ
jgi:predicted Zn-dependent protease